MPVYKVPSFSLGLIVLAVHDTNSIENLQNVPPRSSITLS